MVYKVQDIKSIINVIIPHFDLFPLESAKSVDFQLWKQCVLLMANKEHLTKAGVEKIVSIKGAINKGLPDNLKIVFPHIKVISTPKYIISESQLNPNRITGFTDGDAAFTFTISKNSTIKACYQIHLHVREEPLLIKIQQFFSMAGHVRSWGKKNFCGI